MGANGVDSGFDLYTMSVSSDGIGTYNDYQEAFASYDLNIHYYHGLIYSSDGRVTDPRSGTEMGTYAGFGLSALNSSGTKVFFIEPSYLSPPGTVTIQAFNRLRYTLEGTIQVTANGNPLHLISYGKSGLAFNTDAGQVVLVKGSFVE
jgi:hypothetical protein